MHCAVCFGSLSGLVFMTEIRNLLRSNGNMFTEPLPRNGSGICAHLAVIAYQRLYKPQYSLEYQTMDKSKNSVILIVIHNGQNPSDLVG
jgi:hypothetical protein